MSSIHSKMRPATYLILALFGLPLFVGLDSTSIWDANEAFYVQTPREMLEREDWVVPHFNDRPRLNKPPLSYWVTGGFYKLLGISVLWERLAMALLGLGSVLTAFWIGRLLFDEGVALLGAGILATTFRFLIISRRLFIDVLVLFCILMCIAWFIAWLRSQRGSHFLLSSLFSALGFLSKGPVALLPLLFFFLYLLLTRRLGQLRGAPLTSSALVFFGVTAPWFILLVERSGWDTVSGFFLKENLGRFTHLDYGPIRGYFYYLGVFAVDFFPWSAFFVAALAWWVSKRRNQPSMADSKAMMLLLLWMATWLVLFSFSRNKQEYYILPVYPAAALCIGCYLRAAKVPGWISVSVGTLLAAAGILIFKVGAVLFPDTGLLWVPSLFLLAFPLLALRRRWSAAVLMISFFFVSSFAIYLRPLENYRPVKTFAGIILQIEASRTRPFVAGYYNFTAPSLTYYVNQPILELYDSEEAVRHLNAPVPTYLILEARDYALLNSRVTAPLEILSQRPWISISGRTLLENLKSGHEEASAWTRSIYLVSNAAAKSG